MHSSTSISETTLFKTLLQEKGVYEALRFINSKSAHRFTALYAFEGPILRNVCLVDKENDTVRQMGSIDISDSYCLYVRDSGRTLVTPDSLLDERVKGHPKQATIQSYCGIPLINNYSTLGSLCHFDFTPLAYTEEEILLLERISPHLVTWLENNPLPPLPPEPIVTKAD